MKWYINCIKKYAVFNGRSSRMEYWMFTLISILLWIVLAILDPILGAMGFLLAAYSLGIVIPTFAVAVRRLHDAGHSGWWILSIVIPYVGLLIPLVFYCLNSTPGKNRFGENPKGQ